MIQLIALLSTFVYTASTRNLTEEHRDLLLDSTRDLTYLDVKAIYGSFVEEYNKE